MRIHNVFHVSLLEPWYSRGGEVPEESMPLADDKHKWHVEAILDSMRESGQRYYLVKWQGWPKTYNTWEPKESCKNAGRLVNEY
jgi:hypothetical protein